MATAKRAGTIGLLGVCIVSCAPAEPEERAWTAPPPNVAADYQLGGDYPPPSGVEVVLRDWFAGRPLAGVYSVCYINAFQTQDDEPDVDRPDERSNWPHGLVLTELGDDPNWGGEYLIDLSTAETQRRAASWVAPMIAACADRGFAAVEFDNLDSWTRFEDTPRAGDVPFGKDEAVAYAELLTDDAHRHGLAVAQKNAVGIDRDVVRSRIGFDFAIVERCAEYDECARALDVYGEDVIAVEYEPAAFDAACRSIGARVTVILRDVPVSRPGSPTYRYGQC